MTKVYFSATVNSEGETYLIAVLNVERMRLLKASYYMVMLDGSHPYRFVESFIDEDGVEAVAEPLRRHYSFTVVRKQFSSAQQIMVNKITNISTVIVQRDATSTDMMKSLLRYTQTFEDALAYDMSK